MPSQNPTDLTEHQKNWWGVQKCRRCNPLGSKAERPELLRPHCPDCDGSGWTEWAALATEPWTEIIPRLWIGGHDYNTLVDGQWVTVQVDPPSVFDHVVSMFSRDGYEPVLGGHDVFKFEDSRDFTDEIKATARDAARRVATEHLYGNVMARCQAGLNRSSLVAGLAMILMGYTGEDAVQLIRARRSPWALCNDAYADYLIGDAAADLEREQVF